MVVDIDWENNLGQAWIIFVKSCGHLEQWFSTQKEFDENTCLDYVLLVKLMCYSGLLLKQCFYLLSK